MTGFFDNQHNNRRRHWSIYYFGRKCYKKISGRREEEKKKKEKEKRNRINIKVSYVLRISVGGGGGVGWKGGNQTLHTARRTRLRE